ncbi:MAG: HAMP domain-containing histidine kinase [Acidimicrobiales bacterium]|nr:HAMP domain-containing histidine kinase [Acidimicrobiales bacterium]
MATGFDAIDAHPVETIASALAVLLLTAGIGLALRSATVRLWSLRAQLLAISLAGTLMGALVAWLLATAMILEESQLVPTLAVLGVTFVLAAVVVTIASASLGAAAHRLAETVAAIEGGDRDVRTGIDRRDELGRVADALDQLTVRLATLEAERGRLDAERATMLSSISHDLRSPLAALSAAIEAMMDGVAPDPDRYLRSMRADVDALTSLVEDVFLLASIQGGRLDLDRGSVDLLECCDEAVEALRPTAAARGIDLALRGSRATVPGNARALGRVVRNLLDNAIRHAPEGSVVEISVDGVGTARVTVSDTGAGFPDDFVDRAFDVWARADGSRNRSTGGSGLGLAIAHGLVDAHGGRIWIEPAPGGRVAFELPHT